MFAMFATSLMIVTAGFIVSETAEAESYSFVLKLHPNASQGNFGSAIASGDSFAVVGAPHSNNETGSDV